METYNVGQTVIFDLKLSEIIHTDGKLVTEIRQGAIRCGGNNLQVRVASDLNCMIASWFEQQYKNLLNYSGSSGLNWPDIHRFFVTKCFEVIDHPHPNEYFKDVRDQIHTFINDVQDVLDTRTKYGFNLFRK